MSAKTFFIVQAQNEWRLVMEQTTLLFPIEEQALSTAIKAASIEAEAGVQARVVVEDEDRSQRIVWSSKLPDPAGAEHRKRA